MECRVNEDWAAWPAPDRPPQLLSGEAHVWWLPRDASSRGAVDTILAGYLEIAAIRLKISRGVRGKPAIENDPSLHYNVSHSRDVLLLAVTRFEAVGIDVESLDRRVDYQRVAQRFFSPAEAALVRGGGCERFFTIWSRKEAFLKGIGEGIAFGMNRFSVTLEPGVSPVDWDGTPWFLHPLPPIPGKISALALPVERLRLRCFRPVVQSREGGVECVPLQS